MGRNFLCTTKNIIMPKYVVGQAMNFLGVDLFIKKILELQILGK